MVYDKVKVTYGFLAEMGAVSPRDFLLSFCEICDKVKGTISIFSTVLVDSTSVYVL